MLYVWQAHQSLRCLHLDDRETIVTHHPAAEMIDRQHLDGHHLSKNRGKAGENMWKPWENHVLLKYTG